MLSFLRIRGLALLDDVGLELAPGLNVLTGETGAGKSIIVDALALLRGARGRVELVRAGADAALVDAQFELAPPTATRIGGILALHGLPTDDVQSLLLARQLPKSGRGRSLVQAELTTQSVLAEVGEELIDICSQHEHHSLTNVTRHLELLDGYAGLGSKLESYASSYAEYQAAQRALEELVEKSGDGGRRADYLRFQLDELTRAAPESGEAAELDGRLALLRDAQRWASLARDAGEVLYEAEDSVVGKLALLSERARRGASVSPRLADMAEQLSQAQLACEEAAQLAQRLSQELEFEPGELEQAEERMHLLTTLGRKHGLALDDLPGLAEQLREELDSIDNAEQRIAGLSKHAEQLRQKCVAHALELSRARLAARAGLSRALVAELGELHIPNARLEARVEPLNERELGPRGLDRVEFLFSANAGEPLAPLTRVASGGELSRVLLALKGVLAPGDGVATYVFDEVDAGVGGAVAEAIGRRLRRAASAHQVLCITHLPQIAAFAHRHYRVDKHAEGGRTVTRVSHLSDDERVEELARMLGGAKVSESARRHARELLEQAQQPAAKTAGRKSSAKTERRARR